MSICKFLTASTQGGLVGAALLLLSSCYYQEEDATLYVAGDNFVVSADSLHLQSSQPLHNLPIDTACEQLSVYYNDQLVVAETLVIPEDSVDSVWVKLARDQFTMGWVHSETSSRAWCQTTPFRSSSTSSASAI